MADWEWSSTFLNSGVMPHAEWLSFCNFINSVRIDNGLYEYGFSTSSSFIDEGKYFYAWIFNQAVTAINDLGETIPTKNPNDVGYISDFVNLANKINLYAGGTTPCAECGECTECAECGECTECAECGECSICVIDIPNT